MILYVLVVIATVNGAATVATREFTSRILCDAVATDLTKHPSSMNLKAQCFARVTT